MRRFFLISLVFTVFVSGFSALFPVIAKAVSPYDDFLHTWNPDALEVTNSSAGTRTSFELGQFLLTTGCTTNPQLTDDIINRIREGNATAMSQSITPSDKRVTYYVDATESGDTFSAFWNEGGQSLDVNTEDAYVITWSNSWNSMSCYRYDFPVSYRLSNAPNEFNDRHYLVEYSGFNLDYPPDYEGERLDPIFDGDTYFPEIGYATTTDNILKALYSDGTTNVVCIPVGLTVETGCVTPKLRWIIKNEDNSETLIDTTQELFMPFEYKFPSYATYNLEVSFVHPGTPFAPFSPNVLLITTKIPIVANGTFVVGSTTKNECSAVSGSYVCEEADPFEDCSLYNTDVTISGVSFQIPSTESIGCIVNNFTIWFRNTLIDLFIPNTANLKKSLDSFSIAVQGQFGFIYTSFQMLVDWLNTLLTVNPNCFVDLGDSTFFGATIDINFCAFEQSAPTIYNPLITIARLVLAAGFVFVGYRRLMEITKGLGRS